MEFMARKRRLAMYVVLACYNIVLIYQNEMTNTADVLPSTVFMLIILQHVWMGSVLLALAIQYGFNQNATSGISRITGYH